MSKKDGFTMLELIMVVIIIGTLAALAVPQYTSFVEKARAAEALNYIGVVKKAEISYASQNSAGNFTSSWSALGLSNITPLWRYVLISGNSGVYPGDKYLYVSAYRTGTGPYNGQYLRLLYYLKRGSRRWSGTHPGTPVNA